MKGLPTSPTPKNVADAYVAKVLQPAAESAMGVDGRISKNEASKDPILQDAYAAAGKERPTLNGLLNHAHGRMQDAAEEAARGDGRVSKADAQTMSPIFANVFGILRSSEPSLPQVKALFESKVTGQFDLSTLSNYAPEKLKGEARASFQAMTERVSQSDMFSPPEAKFVSVDGQNFIFVAQFTHDSFSVGIFGEKGEKLAEGDGWGSNSPVDWKA